MALVLVSLWLEFIAIHVFWHSIKGSIVMRCTREIKTSLWTLTVSFEDSDTELLTLF